MEPLELELLLRAIDSLYDRAIMQHFLQALVGQGLRVIARSEDTLFEHVVPEVSLAAQQAVEAFLERRQPDLRLIAYFLGDLRLEVWFTIEPQEGRISFLIDHEHFNGSDEGRAAFEKLLAVLKETYAHWHPFYGYEIYHGGVHPDQTAIQATHEIQHIYTINFLGPEIVEKLGRERILSAPAWRNEPLDDGGVLLIPDNTYYLHIPFAYKRLATALGLQTPQAPGEEWLEDIYDDPAAW